MVVMRDYVVLYGLCVFDMILLSGANASNLSRYDKECYNINICGKDVFADMLAVKSFYVKQVSGVCSTILLNGGFIL